MLKIIVLHYYYFGAAFDTLICTIVLNLLHNSKELLWNVWIILIQQEPFCLLVFIKSFNNLNNLRFLIYFYSFGDDIQIYLPMNVKKTCYKHSRMIC